MGTLVLFGDREEEYWRSESQRFDASNGPLEPVMRFHSRDMQMKNLIISSPSRAQEEI